MTNAKYETREQWLNAFVDYSRPHFERVGAPLPVRVRVSVGFTSSGKRGKAIGECWNDTASADSHFEIFLNPTIETDARICDILTHELIHAAVGIKAGHGPKFRAIATALGLGGKMTATVALADWYLWALPILDDIGPMPYAKLTAGENTGKPKQQTNLLRVECSSCGWLARVTRKHIVPHDELVCPIPSCDGHLVCDELNA